jgi:PAS domain S-box-containing protein
MDNGEISKILLVDDNEFYLSLLKIILKDVEATVYIASSGKEALNLIYNNNFALAVIDIQMPEMDGFELAGRIRNLQNRDLVPIIFLTADFSDEIQLFKGYDYGVIDFLTKPVNKNIFISKIKVFLELDKQKQNLIASKESLKKSKFDLEKKQEQMKLQNIALQNAQAESDESREKYTKLYDFAPTGFFTINKEGTINEINIKGARLLGNDPDELINLNFKDLITSKTLPDFENFLAQVFKKKKQTGCELKLKPGNGNGVYIYMEGALIDDKHTCLLSMVEITERKEAQLALKASEELYHSLLRTSPDGIIIIDLNGRITEASDIAIKLFGIQNRNEIEGLHFINFIPKHSLRSLIEIINATNNKGIVQDHEIQLLKSDHTIFTSEMSTSLVKGNNGETKAFMSVIRDISERKLFEKQLRHSERMTGIGELATGMAHEINQPLNTISLTIDNILFSIDNYTITESYLKTKINKVFDNITRIKKIIDHVRTFSRDQDDFIQTNFGVNESIQNSISMISEQFSNKEIELIFHPGNNLPFLTGNAYRFEQVILNMLINSKDAIEEKKKKSCGKSNKKKIEILTTQKQQQINIEIKDNGIGIAPKDIDKVLLPFFTTKDPGQGTGLGLSISYGIIKELGGEIEITSTIKIGTSIIIKIPVQNSINIKK